MRTQPDKHRYEKRGLVLLLWVSLLVFLGGCAIHARAQDAAPVPSDMLLSASAGMDAYVIDAALDVKAATLTCTQQVVYTNRTGQVQDMLYFHAYANVFKREDTSPATDPALMEETYGKQGFNPGEISFAEVLVQGAPVAFALAGDAETILRVPVGNLADRATVRIDMRYTIRVPKLGFRFGVRENVWSFGNVFPIVAIFEDGAWRLDPYGKIGDPFYSACANYTVTLRAPKGYLAAATGTLTAQDKQTDGSTQFRFEALAVRDFAMTVSNKYKTAIRTEQGVRVTAYAMSDKLAKRTAEIGAQALTVYADILGEPYPYPTLTLAASEMGGYGGMEYPSFAMIDLGQYEDRKVKDGSLEMVIAHEVAHQWWYALVGSDQIRAPWLDEALTEYSAMRYFERIYGQKIFDALFAQRVESAMRVTVPSDRTIAAEAERFSSLAEYSLVVYRRGAGMMLGLKDALGEDVFREVLRRYIGTYRFGFGTREGFERIVNEVTGANWSGYLDDYLDGTM